MPNTSSRSLISASSGRLSGDKLVYLWSRMSARYGHRWTSQFGSEPVGAAAAEWGGLLRDLDNEDIERGFQSDAARADDWPPSSTRFRAMCLPPVSDARRTWLGSSPEPKRRMPAIESDRAKAIAKAQLAKLYAKLGMTP